MKKIAQKITNVEVVKEDSSNVLRPASFAPLERPDVVIGRTYKIKPPVIPDAVYITINDVDGRPIEVFINCKHLESHQWVVAMTRLLSASFRQPGPFPVYIINEMKQTFDPKGGYFVPGEKAMCPSIVAHIGRVIEAHCIELGLIDAPPKPAADGPDGLDCRACGGAGTVVQMDGCPTCTACGDSKCG